MWKYTHYDDNIYYTIKIVPKIIDLPYLVRFAVFSIFLRLLKLHFFKE